MYELLFPIAIVLPGSLILLLESKRIHTSRSIFLEERERLREK